MNMLLFQLIHDDFVYPAAYSTMQDKVMSHSNKALLARNFDMNLSVRDVGKRKRPARATHALAAWFVCFAIRVSCLRSSSMQVDKLVCVFIP